MLFVEIVLFFKKLIKFTGCFLKKSPYTSKSSIEQTIIFEFKLINPIFSALAAISLKPSKVIAILKISLYLFLFNVVLIFAPFLFESYIFNSPFSNNAFSNSDIWLPAFETKLLRVTICESTFSYAKSGVKFPDFISTIIK